MTFEDLQQIIQDFYDVDASALTPESPISAVCSEYPEEVIRQDLACMIDFEADTYIPSDVSSAWTTLQDILNTVADLISDD